MVYSMVNTRQGENEIIIDNYVINDLAAKWEVQWKRQPSTEELKKLVGLYIDQEVLYREALAMNLDHNDEIIKRRLAKKMEFISDDLAESLQPSESLLQEYYFKNIKNYQRPPIYTFTQVYFNNKEVAISALDRNNPQDFGDKLSLPNSFTGTNALKIAIDFGSAFAESLDTLVLNKWVGPVNSGYGYHLVYIEEKKSAGVYSYQEVADKVNMDYNFYESKRFKKELINTLLKDYKLKFEITDGSLKQELIESY